MLRTTLETIGSVLKCDTTLSPADRTRILAMLRNNKEPSKIQTAPHPELRLVRRAEAARRLGCSLRLVDQLAQEGSLPKRKLPNRQRAAGFLESDLNDLIAARTTLDAEGRGDV